MRYNRKPGEPAATEILPYIQQKLNNGQSINSIAKQENISEFTVRYAIKTGKLIKSNNKIRE